MSTATTKLFLVYAPDLSDAAPRRAEVRPKHLEGAKPKIESGDIVIGGAMINAEGGMAGSTMILKGDSLEAVKKTVEEDIYYTGGVWDPSKIVVTEFRPAGPWKF